jgi:hypothetical protein
MEDEEAQVGGWRKKHTAQAFPRLSAPWSHAAKKTPTLLSLAHTRLSYHVIDHRHSIITFLLRLLLYHHYSVQRRMLLHVIVICCGLVDTDCLLGFTNQPQLWSLLAK